MIASAPRILVIRLGALGDILLSMQGFQDIRAAYPDSHITFLTAPAFAAFARSMPWFNEVAVDARAPFYRIDKWLDVRRLFREGRYSLVIDLQNKPRTHMYYRLFFRGAGGKWSGVAPGCELPCLPFSPNMHHAEKVLSQIRAAGIGNSGPLNMHWLQAPLDAFELPSAYAVFVPGCAPHRPEKRWPAQHFAELAHLMHQKGIMPVLVGTRADQDAIAMIKMKAPFVRDLCGATGFAQLASLFRGSRCVVGNDTGPTHLAALSGAPTLAVMSQATNPAQSGPRGPRAGYLQVEKLEDLAADRVLAAVEAL